MPTEDNRIHYIYCITNLINNKLYIGQAIDYKRRFHQHKVSPKYIGVSKKRTQLITLAIAKHKPDNFKFEIIEEWYNQKDTDDAETFWMDFFQSYKREFGYNVERCGKVLSGWKHTQETKNIIKKKRKNQIIWSKGTKGLMRPNKTSFKSGHTSWLKGTKGKAKNQSKLKKEDILYIYNSYINKDKTKEALMEQFSLCQASILRIINGHSFSEITGAKSDFTRKSSKFTNEQIFKIIELNKNGMSAIDISKIYNTNKNNIWNILSGFSFSEITGMQYAGKSKHKIKIDKTGTYDI
jgi:group I intron endonuclease